MIRFFIVTALATSLAACVAATPDDDFVEKIYRLDPNGPPTEVILKRYPSIKPDQVTVHFSYSFECENPKDVGILIGWGDKGQTQGEIIHDFQIRAAKYGANLVVYLGTVNSLAQLDDILRRRGQYSLMHCP